LHSVRASAQCWLTASIAPEEVLMIRETLLGCVLVLVVAFPALADEDSSKPLSRADLDARINRQLYFATVAGVNTFNQPKNDPSGCAAIFQGALTVVEGLLDHRPETQAMVERELKRAEGLTNPVERARALRKVIDDVRAAIEKDQKEVQAVMWNRLGGEKNVRAVVHDFITSAAADPKVDLTRGGKFPVNEETQPKLEQSLVEYISSLTGGPLQYKGKDMKAAHAEMGITDEQFAALAEHFVAALKKHKVPAADVDAITAALAATKKEIVAAAPKGPEQLKAAPRPLSLWKELGGAEAIKPIVHDFIERALKNEKVDLTRGGKFKLDEEAQSRLEQSLVDYLSTMTDGPVTYKGKDMKAAHEGMKITDAQFDALAADLLAVLKEHKVEQEHIDELMKLMEATRKDIVEKE
jgi:hemoglobin